MQCSDILCRLVTTDPKLQHVTTMRVLGGLLFLLGVAELSLGLFIFTYLKSIHLGSWWGAICTIICGFLGLFSNNRSVVMAGCAVSSLGLVAAAVAMVLDGVSAESFKNLVSCGNTATGIYYGKTDAKKALKSCAKQYKASPPKGNSPYVHSGLTQSYDFYSFYDSYGYYNDYSNNETDHDFYFDLKFDANGTDDFVVGGGGNHNYYGNYFDDRDRNDDNPFPTVAGVCICTDGQLCYDYSLSRGDDCGNILTTYSDSLVASCTILGIGFLALLIYCVVAFSSACSSGEFKIAADSEDREIVQLSDIRQQSYPPTPLGHQQTSFQSATVMSPYAMQQVPQPVAPVPQYVQLGSAERPVYILQMYAPTPGLQATPQTPVFISTPGTPQYHVVAASSDSIQLPPLSKEHSFNLNG